MTTQALIAHPTDLALSGPIGSFDAYLDRVSRIPVLSRDEERELTVTCTAATRSTSGRRIR
jgi:hypothetical protein